jgi:hypothetical protein
MPRFRADGATPQWPQLEVVAAEQQGYFSLRQAAACGISSQLLLHHARAGRLRRVGRGAFHLSRFAPSTDEACVVAWLWSEGQGVLSHHTALWLHGLLDARPAYVYLSVPHEWRGLRLTIPSGMVVCFSAVADFERTGRAPLPFTSLDASLIAAAASGYEPGLVKSAFAHALEWGLRDAGTLRIWLHPHHPLFEHYRAASERAPCEDCTERRELLRARL